ncbi:MAG: MBL fold metallo-hydrolase [Polyangia bacterium]
MAPRRRSRLSWIAVALVATFVTFVVTMRMLRRRTSAPEPVGRVQRERNFFTDLYGARTSAGIVVFDAGIDTEGGALDRLLGSLGGTRSDVHEVLLTHGHFDHVAAAPLCVHARIRVGAPDVEFMAQRAPMIGTLPARLFRDLLPVHPVQTTDPLVGRVEIPIGDDKVLAIPTPGHTPGSYVFVFDKILFAGDSITIDGERLGFAMRPFTIDPDGNRRALAGLAAALDGVDVQTVCTGHQGCTPAGKAPAMLKGLFERAKAVSD